MKNFTVIEKKHGNAWGFWFAELADAQNKELVAALSSKQGWPNKLCAMALLGDYEIWRNTFGAGGGYLVLFGKEEISVLCLTEPAYQRGDKKKYGLLRCRCGSLYRGHFDPDIEVGLLCGCGLAVDMPKVATSLAHDPQSETPSSETLLSMPPEKTLTLLDQAIQTNPNDAWAWQNRGVALDKLGRSEDAIDSYRRAGEMNPVVTMAWANLGELLRKLGRHDEAIESYKRGIELWPEGGGDLWNGMGIAYTELNRYGDALPCFEED